MMMYFCIFVDTRIEKAPLRRTRRGERRYAMYKKVYAWKVGCTVVGMADGCVHMVGAFWFIVGCRDEEWG